MFMLASDGGQNGGEPDPEVDRLIHETKPRSGVGKTIAFLGEVSVGKTVVAALLKHTLSTKWVPGSNGRWDALMVSGHDEINETIRKMKGGSFPSATLKDVYPALRIDMYRMMDTPSKIELMLHDISGESYFEHLSGSPPANIDETLASLLKGDGSYIAHATAYVLMISCKDVNEWDTDKPKAANAIRTIHAIKRRMNCLDTNGCFMTPIALVFTKGDTLPPNHAQKSAAELVDMYPDLASALRITHSGQLACFKVQVATRRAQLEQNGDSTGVPDHLQQASSDTDDSDGDQPGEEDDDEQELALRPAVPLNYSSQSYYKLITWLVDGR